MAVMTGDQQPIALPNQMVTVVKEQIIQATITVALIAARPMALIGVVVIPLKLALRR